MDRKSRELVSYNRTGGMCGEEYMEYFTMRKKELFLIKAKWTEQDEIKDWVTEDSPGCFVLTGVPLKSGPWVQTGPCKGVSCAGDPKNSFFHENGLACGILGRYKIKVTGIEPYYNLRMRENGEGRAD